MFIFSKHISNSFSSIIIIIRLLHCVCVCLCLQMYLKSLGKARTAQVKRDARIGEAEAKRDSGIKVGSHPRILIVGG